VLANKCTGVAGRAESEINAQGRRPVTLDERLRRIRRHGKWVCQMPVWKDGMTTEQVVRKALRSFLVRCHSLISEDYPEIAGMSAEDSADFLLHLQDTGRIDIQLNNKDGDRIGCEISELRQQDEERLT
jgi:hypothetical protein